MLKEIHKLDQRTTIVILSITVGHMDALVIQIIPVPHVETRKKDILTQLPCITNKVEVNVGATPLVTDNVGGILIANIT